MENSKKIGVFLCQCDGRIDPWIDLPRLKDELGKNSIIEQVEILPLACTVPGINRIRTLVQEKGLNRLVIAGCEARILLKKFHNELADIGVIEGQIDMVNLRDHVSAVHNLQPQELASKGAKLIQASVAGLAALEPTVSEKVEFVGPVLLLGGGIATYPAAQELLRKNIDCILAVQTEEYEDEIRMLHEHYPGERHYYDRLRKIMAEVDESPLVRRITVGELQSVRGRTGHYTVTFSTLEDGPPKAHEVGAIIACLDGQMLNQGSNFGHDGKTVICHTETEELIWTHGVPGGKIVFWINDYESQTPQFAYLSSRCA